MFGAETLGGIAVVAVIGGLLYATGTPYRDVARVIALVIVGVAVLSVLSYFFWNAVIDPT